MRGVTCGFRHQSGEHNGQKVRSLDTPTRESLMSVGKAKKGEKGEKREREHTKGK